MRKRASCTLYRCDQRWWSAMAATTRPDKATRESAFRTCPSFRNGLSSTTGTTSGCPSASRAPAMRGGPRRARVNFCAGGNWGNLAKISSSAKFLSSGAAGGRKLSCTKSVRYSSRTNGRRLRCEVRLCHRQERDHAVLYFCYRITRTVEPICPQL